MRDFHPESPEARRQRLARLRARLGPEVAEAVHDKPLRVIVVLKRVGLGVYNDGFIHAGNLAYVSLLALFPFIIFATAIAQLVGRGADGELTVVTILSRLPPEVARVLSGPIAEVIRARTGPLLWFGAVVGLWSAASFIETIRDILRRAYGVRCSAPFWTYRLGSIALIVAAVLMLLAAFGATVMLSSIHHYLTDALPFSDTFVQSVGIYRLIPGITLFGTFYALFLALTPARYRKLECRKWPGALLVTLWWLGTVELLPWALGLFGGYAITYGSLAGVMVALIFFFVIGLGVVTGAELNAALADAGDKALEGEVYQGPYRDDLDIEPAAPDEIVDKGASQR